MDLFEKLERAAQDESEKGELPQFLLEPILAVARNRGEHPNREELVALLLEQVEGYDPYAGVGCFGEGYSAGDIQRTLARLAEAKPR